MGGCTFIRTESAKVRQHLATMVGMPSSPKRTRRATIARRTLLSRQAREIREARRQARTSGVRATNCGSVLGSRKVRATIRGSVFGRDRRVAGVRTERVTVP
ncbi:hypothetical protein R1flu_025992 [Riccia fluitans]|uniref:Ribosomal protein S14 n=1 Tax=Riccia fluitans TaxID=41844 RepID=A0ABD1XEN7_9MARC